MAEIISFFSPELTSGLLRGLLTGINILFVLGTGFLLRFLLREYLKKRNPKYSENRFSALLSLAAAFAVIALFCELCIRNGTQASASGRGMGAFLDFFWTVLNPIFSIGTMLSSPFPYFTGLNLAIRMAMLCTLLAVIWFCYQTAETVGTRFWIFLENKARRLQMKAAQAKEKQQDEHTEGKEGTQATAPEQAGKDGEAAQEKQGVHYSVALLHELMKASPLLGFLAMLFSYALGTNDTQDAIVEILQALRALLDTITLTAKLETATGGIAVFLSNFLYVILSICILAVYGAGIILLCMFLGTAVKHRGKIVKWVFDKRNVIWRCVAVILLLVLAGTFIFALSAGFESIRDVFKKIFEAGSIDLLHIALAFFLLVLLFSFVMLMLGFAVVFVIFIASFGYQVVKKGLAALEESSRILRYAKGIAFLIAGAGFVLCVMFGYEPIRSGLEALLIAGEEEGQTLPWVLEHILLLYIQALGFLLLALFLFTAAEKLIAYVYRFLRKPGQKTESLFQKLIGAVVHQCVRFLYLIPFTLGQIYQAATSFIATMMRIFVGYSTESQKNQAIFVAACFASLASLLNTFFGLRDFYKSDTSLIPVICSFAIACAVQLAMLIFGMKGGEAIAESMLSDQLRFGKDHTRVLISKLFCCLVYLLIYLTATAIIFFGGLANDWGFRLDTVLPVILFLAASVAFAYGMILQIIDIRVLWKARKAAAAAEKSVAEIDKKLSGQSEVRKLHRPRHMPPRFYLAAYFLLMIVSTGFAFNNLFGYYAQQAHVHQQVFDQVRSEASRQLDVNGQVTDLVSQYYTNINAILEELDERATAVTKKRESDLADLKAYIRNTAGEEYTYTIARAENFLGQYTGNTADFQTVYSALKTYLKMDYDRLGEQVKITVNTYNHYWGGNPQPSYQSGCIEIEPAKGDTSYVGNFITLKSIEEIEIDDIKYDLVNRYQDPDSISQQSISVMSRTIEQGDKYTVLEEILSFFEAQERTILDYDVERMLAQLEEGQEEEQEEGEPVEEAPAEAAGSDTGADDESGGEGSQVRSLLDQNAILDGIRGSLAQLYWESGGREESAEEGQDTESGPEQEIVSVDDLSRIVDVYLDQGVENDQKNPAEATPADQQKAVPEKETDYQELDVYIDRMLQVNNILSAQEAVSALEEEETDREEQGGNGTAGAEKSPDEAETDKTYVVRRYRNYAQGIVYSNFQISYDALFGGGMGLNENAGTINALYRSTAVAVFIFLICVLVDLMAFFVGLLLFKDAYLFERGEKLKELGYLNYEAALTNLFRVPSGGRERLLHLALIYRLLYGDSALQYPNEKQIFSAKIMQSGEFRAMFDEIWEVLERLDLCGSHMADLRLWLLSYVEKNEINFEELFEDTGSGDTAKRYLYSLFLGI